MMQHEDPWASIARPGDKGGVSGRRAAASGRWNFFWARDDELRPLLLLQHGPLAAPSPRLPMLRGLEIIRVPEADNQQCLVFRLLDITLIEPFAALCHDLIAAAEAQVTEEGAIGALTGRSWRWHHLLRGGSRQLSIEQIKGLIGELLTLRDVVMPNAGVLTALEAWRGPLGATHDFVFRNVALECKTRRGAQSDHIRISSEFQLDASGLAALYLRVIGVGEADSEADGSFTFEELLEAVRSRVAEAGPKAVSLFEARLEAEGVQSGAEYPQGFWVMTDVVVAQVGSGFPRLIASELPDCISGVSYSVSVDALSSFVIDERKIWPDVSQE
jgi:hypothetical protein